MAIPILAIDFCTSLSSLKERKREILSMFSTMGLSAISDFAGFNQLAASSNFALIYKADVCITRRKFVLTNFLLDTCERYCFLSLVSHAIWNLSIGEDICRSWFSGHSLIKSGKHKPMHVFNRWFLGTSSSCSSDWFIRFNSHGCRDSSV